ncbi:MAG: GNAT family N-acetyltransferase [Burkholderiaceae bacterium]|nr:GNAT family N-acetyltransferase [Burkholderiaceae bacterium]
MSDLASIGRDRWDALVDADPSANVFLRYDLLHALHETACAAPRAGWAPQYLVLWRDAQLAGAVPLYAKGHSYGEYVFDWAWAEAYQRSERAGLAYYPKWLAAVPFTPVGGSRLIAVDDAARVRLADALVAHAQASELSSLHVLFAPRAQIDLLAARGLLVRHGVQFHWRNAGYADFDAFLAALAQPKRKKIRAERRKVAEAGVRLTRKTGRDIAHEDWQFFFRCYQHTYATHWSTPYLNLRFFERMGKALADHVLLVVAERAGVPIASGLGVFDGAPGAARLYGRYWGALAEVPCLHFEVCYYQMIEFAIEQHIAVFEGGAQGAHKLARGLDAVETLSAHWIADAPMREAIGRFLVRETDQVEHTLDELHEHRAFKTAAATTSASGTDAAIHHSESADNSGSARGGDR